MLVAADFFNERGRERQKAVRARSVQFEQLILASVNPLKGDECCLTLRLEFSQRPFPRTGNEKWKATKEDQQSIFQQRCRRRSRNFITK